MVDPYRKENMFSKWMWTKMQLIALAFFSETKFLENLQILLLLHIFPPMKTACLSIFETPAPYTSLKEPCDETVQIKHKN